MLGQALGAMTLTRLGLRVFALATVRRGVRWMLAAERPLPHERRCSATEVIRAVISAGKHCPVGSTCLASALVGQALLGRHGYVSELRLGVRRAAGGAFAAHAWLERDGKVVLGGPGEAVAAYTPMPEMEHLIR